MSSDAGAYPGHLNRQIHGLRGFSALAVFVYHVYGMGTLWNFWPESFDPAAPLFAAGKHGVEIFFIISGYLITGSLVRHGDARTFLVDRAIRIYPVFMTIQLLVFGLGPLIYYKWFAGISLGQWALAFVENGLFLPGLFDLPLAQLNAWSLSYEAAFYLASALCFVAARRLGRVPALLLALAIIIGLIPLYPRASFFLPGIAVFLAFRRSSWRGLAWQRWLSAPALVATLALLTVAESQGSLFYVALAPALLFFVSIVVGRCHLSAFLRLPWLQYLGTISYSFYLWSPVVTYPMKLFIERVLLGRMPRELILLSFAGIGLVASIVVSAASYRWLEDRVGRWLKTKIGVQTRRTIIASARSTG